MTRLGFRVLDGPGRSIARHNVKLLTRQNKSVAFVSVTVKAPSIWLCDARKGIRSAIQKWAASLANQNLVVVCHYQLSSPAFKSIFDTCGNAKSKGMTCNQE